MLSPSSSEYDIKASRSILTIHFFYNMNFISITAIIVMLLSCPVCRCLGLLNVIVSYYIVHTPAAPVSGSYFVEMTDY